MPLKSLFVKYMPFLGKYKRWMDAVIQHVTGTKASYAQNNEDVKIKIILGNYNLKDAIYIDVGANHPMRISNTYLFYRNGFNGITIEPNTELYKLHRKFRKRDIALNLGCGATASLEKFNIYNTPVLGDFNSVKEATINIKEKRLITQEYLPVLPLDIILENINYKWIFFMNVDVEGMDYQVLEGCQNTLPKILVICIESNNENEYRKVVTFLQKRSFKLIEKDLRNSIFINQDLNSKLH